VKTKKHKLAVQNKAANNSISDYLSTKNISELEKQLSLGAQEATYAYHTAVPNHNSIQFNLFHPRIIIHDMGHVRNAEQ
jgi:hypothetical protein